MRSFNILDRQLNSQRHYLLEASAGTGKTFSIENIVGRLLIAPEPLRMEQILVVTFTRAATRDLIHRIRCNIIKILDYFENKETQDVCPDYLQHLMEQSQSVVDNARRQLEDALFHFDDAQIFTIHGFCHCMLHDYVFEGGISLKAIGGDTPLPRSKIEQIIRDFLRTQLNPALYNKEQIKALLKAYKNSEGLLTQLQNVIQNGFEIECTLSPENNTDPSTLFAHLASDCQKHLKKYLMEEELYGYDDILFAMQRSLRRKEFAERIRHRYRAVIIDEFQDTDPVQWEIFKTLFLDYPGQLYLVGDPKQSIYAFRRADIYTYLSAAKALDPDSAASLDTNYRSQPSLISALNAFFESAADWIYLPKWQCALPFQPVKANPKALSKSFDDGKGCLHFFIAEAETKSRSFPLESIEERYFFPFIVQEIQSLRYVSQKPLRNCAILVKDRYQANRLMAVLKHWQIPAMIQRQSLLGATQAVSALRELLEGVLYPRTKIKTALGGSILGWTHDRLQQLEDPACMELVLNRFYSWRKLWIDEGFNPFFRQVLENISESLLSREGGLSLYHDLLQLYETLSHIQGASPEALIDALNEMGDSQEGDECALKRRPNIDLDAIQIITIHASKGLEFDIVFALGLASRSKELEPFVTVSENGSQCLMHVSNPEDPRYLNSIEESEAEKMRQLYVAMTRAKYRLYVPIIDCGECFPPKQGTASPIELFIARMGYPPSTLENVYARLNVKMGKKLYEQLDALHQKTNVSYVILNGITCNIQRPDAPKPPVLLEPPIVKIPGDALYLHSFTTLSKGIVGGETTHVESSAPHDLTATIKTPHTLPAGSSVGNLLHQILENLIFKSCSPIVVGNEFKEWKAVIDQIIFNAVNTSFPLKTGPTALIEVSSQRMYRETEFVYPWTQPALWPEIEYFPGYLKGIIDLIFEHQGYYYLVDWKSNWLGPGVDDYHREAMEREMMKNQYFLQARIYKEALQRYLKIVDPRPFDEIFGGTFYVFLRGLSQDSDYGIYKI